MARNSKSCAGAQDTIEWGKSRQPEPRDFLKGEKRTDAFISTASKVSDYVAEKVKQLTEWFAVADAPGV
jgi:hypothetical protein